ncbi:hypothetical protein OAT93_01995 [bacterium]|nr:hypothetical protein [bacterium]
MADKINYTDKEQGQVSTEPVNKRWNFGDANEVKSVVNSHADDIDSIAGAGLSNPLSNIDFTPQGVSPTHLEGRVFYDEARKTLNYYNDINDMTVNISEETIIPVWNDTGVTITNGQVVKSGLSAISGFPTIVLAQADNIVNARVLGVATHDIETGTKGYITLIGTIGGLDTSSFATGDVLYLSETIAGGYSNIEQPILSPIGQVLVSDAIDGVIFILARGVLNLTALGQVRGVALHSQDVTTTPTPCYAFDLGELELNVDVTQVLNPGTGNGYDALMSPSSIGASGFYGFTFSVSIQSVANRVYVFELYGNGLPTGLIVNLDLSNNNIDAGNGSFTGVTESQVLTGQGLEIYVYTQSGAGTLTYDSALFGIERKGNA